MNPPWANEDAVYRLVQGELEDITLAGELQFSLLDWDTFPDLPVTDFIHHVEQQALDAWWRGDPSTLIKLLRSEHPFNEHPMGDRALRDQLSEQTWALICERLQGKPLKRGRPKRTADERRARNPIHDAADIAPTIENILRQNYPHQDVRDRAYAFAEKLMGIDDPNSAGSKVRNYLNKSKTARARLT